MLIYESFLQTSIPPLISIFYAKEGLSRLFVQNFLSHGTEKFHWGTLPCIRKFGYRKILCIREGDITFLRRKLLSHITEKFRWGTLRCFRHFRVSQNFMHKKGLSLNSVEQFFSHSADKIRRRTLLCFARILVSKIFKQRRGEASRFCRKFFYLTGPKKFRQGTILCFRKFLVGKKNLWIRRGGITIFRRKFFVSLYQNISLENTLVFQKNSFIENFHAWEGGGEASRFCRNFLSHRTETKSFVKNPSVFQKISGIEKNLWTRGGISSRFSVEIFVSQCRKNS